LIPAAGHRPGLWPGAVSPRIGSGQEPGVPGRSARRRKHGRPRARRRWRADLGRPRRRTRGVGHIGRPGWPGRTSEAEWEPETPPRSWAGSVYGRLLRGSGPGAPPATGAQPRCREGHRDSRLGAFRAVDQPAPTSRESEGVSSASEGGLGRSRGWIRAQISDEPSIGGFAARSDDLGDGPGAGAPQDRARFFFFLGVAEARRPTAGATEDHHEGDPPAPPRRRGGGPTGSRDISPRDGAGREIASVPRVEGPNKPRASSSKTRAPASRLVDAAFQ